MDQFVADAGDFVEVFEADDGEPGSGEAMLDGILRRAGFSFRRRGSGTSGSVGTIDGDLMLRGRLALPAFWLFRGINDDGFVHGVSSPLRVAFREAGV